MGSDQENNIHHQDPLHGLTLKTIVTDLVQHFGWEELAKRIFERLRDEHGFTGGQTIVKD